ncbi:MAG: hypothetical protein Q8M20_18050 [Rhodocyclaceae bacterium]|nr:hypothetical protein [Rhodocyclaceae bacterium]
MTDKLTGRHGNKNAEKSADTRAAAVILLRCKRVDKARWQAAADAAAMPLSKWIISRLG